MLPESIIALADQLRSMPGIGRRSAQKLALDLLSMSDTEVATLLQAVEHMRKTVHICKVSGVFCESDISPMLTDARRNQRQICIVHQPTDVLTVEKTGVYVGVFHVLHTLINPLDNVFAGDTTIGGLFNRLHDLGTTDPIELVFFLRDSFAAEATMSYIKQELDSTAWEHVRLTRLAQGLPLHFSVEYLDQATMIKAFEDRKAVV
jgi:recombination protein RecR